MGAVSDSLQQIKSATQAAGTTALSLITKGKLQDLSEIIKIAPYDGFNQIAQFQQQAGNRQRYSLYRGWVHSAITALAFAAAKQPPHVGKLGKSKKPGSRKVQKMLFGQKSAAEEFQILPDHKFLPVLNKPNPMQHRWQFVNSFVANLCLTGWSFVVGGETDDGWEMYSVPTNWVLPDHEEGPFSRFKIINPNAPESSIETPWLDRSQVAFSYFPNPADPIAALSLTQAQQMGIKIDDHIQTSQSTFFENGVFPSVIITVGSQPHPGVPAGVRPRLSAVQRRQIYAAIRKVSGGVANYGNPAIVDGLIEKIERLSATQNEMGWEKSEQTVRTRILSAFGVHPFILGETIAGSYAQAYVIREVFCDRVNIFLDLLSLVVTELGRSLTGDEDMICRWHELKPKDPSMEQQIWNSARSRGDVSQNEFRDWMGLPPEEDAPETFIDKTEVVGVLQIASQATAGQITPEQGIGILMGLGIPENLAKQIAGDGPPEEEEAPPDENAGYGDADQEQVQKAIDSLDHAVAALESAPMQDAIALLEQI